MPLERRGEVLAKSIRELKETAAEVESREGPMWHVHFTPPAERLFCDGGARMVVIRALIGCRVTYEERATNVDGVSCVAPVFPVEHLAMREVYMREFMPIARASELHGEYWQSGLKDEKRYKF